VKKPPMDRNHLLLQWPLVWMLVWIQRLSTMWEPLLYLKRKQRGQLFQKQGSIYLKCLRMG
jgi:hypothetical protein